MLLHGIDVSHHNGPSTTPLDVDFAIIRVGFGLPDGRCANDEAAEKHLDRLAKVPVLVAYWYLSTAKGAASGEAQANFFLERHAALERRFGPMGLALDSEPLRARDAAGNPIPWDPADHVRGLVMGFLACVSTSPRRCLCYGSREWWQRLRLDWWAPLDFDFWAASAPPAPDPWPEVTIQQLPAPVAGVDRDTFEGTLDELRAVLGLAPGPLPPSHAHGLMARGSIGPEVRELQARLNKVGAALDVDGVFGPRTEGAVRAFQRAKGLHVDGIAGPATWSALDGATVAP